MLMRTDPFRDLDRLTRQLLGTASQPAVMPMDAWQEGEQFVVEFDLPGMDPDSLDLDVDRNVVTVHAERPVRAGEAEMIAAERRAGYSVVNCSWARTSTPTISRPATTLGC